MSYFIDGLTRYADFKGRARRKEYWMFFLFYYIFAFVVGILSGILSSSSELFLLLPLVYSLAMILPLLSVSVRRLHDINKSGAWLLIGLVPFAGGIILLIFACTDSTPGPNQYGENPKGY